MLDSGSHCIQRLLLLFLEVLVEDVFFVTVILNDDGDVALLTRYSLCVHPLETAFIVLLFNLAEEVTHIEWLI